MIGVISGLTGLGPGAEEKLTTAQEFHSCGFRDGLQVAGGWGGGGGFAEEFVHTAVFRALGFRVLSVL